MEIEYIKKIYLEINGINYDKVELSVLKKNILDILTITKNSILINNEKLLRNICLQINLYCLDNLNDEKIKIQQIALELFNKKNKDYGNSYQLCNTIGVIIRILDKINRLLNLKKIKSYNVDESYLDTILDLHNYTLLAIICLDYSQ